MPMNESGLENAFGFAGIGRWELTLEAKSLVLDAACREIFEVSDAEALSQAAIIERVDEADRARVFGALEALSEVGGVYDETFRLNLPSGEPRWVRGVAKCCAESGSQKVIGVSFDVTSEQQLLAERELHLSEINHRIKNLFALVSAMISTASRENSEKDAVVDDLRGRIAALDRAHSLMLSSDASRPIPLGELLGQILAPARSQQTIVMSGQDVLIPAPAVTSLVLIVHEWVTNSAKFGALKHADGTIHVEWTLSEGDVHIVWSEKVPEFDEGADTGFGSRLVQMSVMQLRADMDRRFEDGWLTTELKVPLDDE